MKCPRRYESAHGMSRLPEEDHYRDDDTCSYCGSLNPEIFMARIEASDIEVGPTDKNYKVYVGNKGGPKFKMRYRKDCDMGKVGSKCSGPDDCVHWHTEEREHSKFYFQHLSQEQMRRFVDLYNDRKMIIGYPGHFYALPFFMRRENATTEK